MKKRMFVLLGILALGIAPAALAQFDIVACCFDDGSCADLLFVDCIMQGGTAFGPGSTCATTTCPTPDEDWGDAPDPTYPTLATNNGAVHIISLGFALGGLVDNESDGQPNADATGDDLDFSNDEDGITFSTALIPGSNAAITVVTTGEGLLDAWIDFDQSGTWDEPQENLFAGSLLVAAGTTSNVVFAVPASASVGDTFARFRFSSAGSLLPTGPANDGEVEDYKVTIGEFDWGDAPDAPYATLASGDGARHVALASPRLGTLLDAELDGQPDSTATGDDLNGVDDEDGLTFLSPIRPGVTSTASVSATGASQLDAWIDFDRNGTWEHPAEHIFGGTSVSLSSGSNPGLIFMVPANALPGASYLRLRVSSVGSLAPTGLALDGEVEDYAVVIDALDWGDAPDPTYPTLRANTGAYHLIVPGYRLGGYIDHEVDGQPGPGADGDDLDGTGQDDEDGVYFLTQLVQGRVAVAEISTGSSNCFLDAWVDFDQDGSWESGEHLNGGISMALPAFALTNLDFQVPASAVPGDTYARFRISSSGNLSPSGFAGDGEVEDYKVTIEELDWGDAPDPTYPTLRAMAGAHHVLTSNVVLGVLIDGEMDGQPTATALGDDLAGSDDEDGVTFTTLVAVGQQACIDVIAGAAGGKLDAWIDFNGNGVWAGPAERLFGGSVTLNPGLNAGLCFTVPAQAVAGQTMARFRLSTTGGLSPSGFAADGEVEDYQLTIEELDWGDAPDPGYPTLLASSGARHVITPGVNLGTLIDMEVDGQPTASALGDDLAGSDDEDGVTFTTLVAVGQQACIDVIAGAAGGKLDAWIDFNGNGTWEHPAEHLFGSSISLSAGLNPGLCFAVPPDAVAGPTVARFRLSVNGGLTPVGLAPDGEVEDYATEVVTLDWGDAPDPFYATLEANNGPSHILRTGYLLGSMVDDETDGQPDPDARGDDLSNLDDEDGVFFAGPIVRGGVNCITVLAGPTGGVLNAWIDFDANGTFDHPSERLFSGPGLPLTPGANSNVCFTVPWDTPFVTTYARFRLSSAGGLGPTGQAPDGEVEDYGGLLILQPHPQAPVEITDISPVAGSAVVSWNAESNILYQLQSTTNIVELPEPAWTDVGSPVLGPSDQQSDPLAGQPDKAYRVKVPMVP